MSFAAKVSRPSCEEETKKKRVAVEMREQIRLNGIVRGEGRESTCTISATRVHLPGASGASETTNWSISKVSEALPDGDYDIFADQSASMYVL
jgi:hypothetical protein